MRIGHIVAAIAIVSFLLQGCVSPSNGPSTAMDSAIQNCTLSIVGGAALGLLLGSQSGNAGRGAAIGGAIGSAACAVFVKIANDKDRARIAALERQAISSNRDSSDTFQAQDGSQVTVHTHVRDTEVPDAPDSSQPQYTACRYSQQKIDLQGQSANVEPQLWCRLETGDWKPVAQQQ